MPSQIHLFVLALTAAAAVALATPVAAAPVDGFEAGLPNGVDAGAPIGFITFAGAGSSAAISTTAAPPAQPPGAAAGNHVLQLDVDRSSFAGVLHNFENPAVDTWVPRDWSAFDALTLWLYGNNSGTVMFVDVLDNRNPGSTTDDAERWVSIFFDDFIGWKQLSFSFSGFVRKEIGNGAPNDGLGLTAVHGWALGTLGTDGPRTFYVDDVQVVSVPEPGTLALLAAGLLASGAAVRRRRG